jgi:hypothetical protein
VNGNGSGATSCNMIEELIHPSIDVIERHILHVKNLNAFSPVINNTGFIIGK